MHFFDSKSFPATTRWVRLAVCTLLPAFIQEAAAIGMQRPNPGRSSAVRLPPPPAPAPAAPSAPYLLVCVPLPLRFAEPVATADPVSSLPTVLGPPHPGGLLEEIATVNQQAALPFTGSFSAGTLSTESDSGAPSPDPGSVPIPTSPPQVGIAILPDDTPRAVRPEDVLIYFQLPASSPTHTPPPRSSATYRQQ
jgi:hypothetical protein